MRTFKVMKQLGVNLRPRKVKRFATAIAVVVLVGLVVFYNVKYDNPALSLARASLYHEAVGPHDATTQTQGQGQSRELTSSKRCPDLKITLPLDRVKYFQEVKRTDTFIYSAYTDGNHVRLMAVRRHSDHEKLFCHLWYDVKDNDDVSGDDPLEVTPARVESIPEGHGMRFTATYIVCNWTEKRKNLLPIAVSIAPTECLSTPGNALPVQPPGALTSKFTVCVTPLNNRYRRTQELVEMIEFNRLLGADRIAFYNYSTHPVVDKILRRYIQQGLVEVYPWNLPTTEIHYFGQLASLNDCLYQHRNSSQYLVYQDLDEFIIPQGALTNWEQLIQQRRTAKPKAAVYQVKNVFFRREWPKTWHKFPFNEKAIKYRSIILQTTIKERQVLPYNQRSKFILDPRQVTTVGIHFVWEAHGQTDHVPEQQALMCHFRNWHAPEDKQPRLEDTSVVERFGQAIVERLDSAWADLELAIGLTPDVVITKPPPPPAVKAS